MLDLAGAHQAWSFYLYTYLSMLLDVAGCSAVVLFLSSARCIRVKWKFAIAPIALFFLAEFCLVLVLKSVTSATVSDFGYCLATSAAQFTLAWYLIRAWRAGNLYGKLLFFPFVIDATEHVYSNIAFALRDIGIRWAVRFAPVRIVLLHQPFEINPSRSLPCHLHSLAYWRCSCL